MIIPIELSFKADKDTRMAVSTNKTIKSHDVNSVEFHIAIEGLELTNNHTAKILSIFHSSQSQVNTDCEIVDGKIIYKPDTKLISMYETVTNYVYVYYNDQSVDVCAFKYTVDLSKIDETALTVKEVYDKSYADLLANFEQALSDYKDSLPQADSVRAEIDAILNQFGVDGETAISDFRQQADTDAEVKLTEIQSDANQLFSGAINQFKQDGANEIADWRDENSGELENLQTEIAKKANREQEDWITPTLLNGWYAIRPNEPPQYMKDEFGFVHFRGAIAKSPESGSNVAFQLPEDYRPDINTSFNCVEIGASGFRSLATTISSYKGNVDFAGAKTGTVSWYTLSHTFKAV